jgi:hypothetical protein
MSKARDLANAGTALTTVSATELGYLDGVTSAVQTQIDSKQAVVSGVDNTEIGYLNGVTSAIQTQINAQIPKSTVTAKGDLIVGTASGTVVAQAVGANGTVLTANSAQADGVEWAALPASGAYTLISEQQASASTGLTFGSIPSTYKHLYLVWSGLNTSNDSTFELRINNDSANNYKLAGVGAGNQNAPALQAQENSKLGFINFIQNCTTVNQHQRAAGSLFIENYTSTTRFKTFTILSSYNHINNGISAQTCWGSYSSTSAITSLDLVRTAGTGTVTNATSTSFRLYGVN